MSPRKRLAFMGIGGFRRHSSSKKLIKNEAEQPCGFSRSCGLFSVFALQDAAPSGATQNSKGSLR